MPELTTDQRARISEAAQRAGLSLTTISLGMKRNPGWLARRLADGRRPFRDEDFAGIAALTGASAKWLETGIDVADAAAPLIAATVPGRRDLPLYRGFSVGGLATAGISAEPREVTTRPSMLAGVPDSFAVRLADDRLRPRYRRGDVLFFHPGSEPEAGDCIAVTLADRSHHIGLLVAVDGRGIRVESLNPNATHTFRDPLSVAREVGVERR